MRLRRPLIVLAAALVSLALAGAGRAESGLIVVELFTSQGCASCPPADAVLARLAADRRILALSEHVDYWDYLGWRDPFAIAATVARQKAYAERLGLPYVYTPQMIIQGSTHVMGSDHADVLAAIAALPGTDEVPLELRRGGPSLLTLSLGTAPSTGPFDLWLVVYGHRRATRIEAGENTGRSLHHVNVVQALRRIGSWSGAAEILTVALQGDEQGGDACAVLVQEPGLGRILAAARLPVR